jgi:hypothetical protein
MILRRKRPAKVAGRLKGGTLPTPIPCFLVKSSDLPDTNTLSENKVERNDIRVRNVLIANEMSDLLSALECARCELLAMS